MKRFNRILIKFAFALITVYLCHSLSDSFEMGGIAGIIIVEIYQLIDEITKEENK